MRGRKPRKFTLAAHDVPILQQIARSRTLPWFQVQRARAVLAMADGERVRTVAFQSDIVNLSAAKQSHPAIEGSVAKILCDRNRP